MSRLSKIYQRSPLWLQNLMVSSYGYYWQQRRFGGLFPNEYKSYRERECYSPQQWQDYLNQELQKLLLHAWDQVPYYRNSFQLSGFDRNKLAKIGLDSLHHLPLLDKISLKQEGTKGLLAHKREFGGQFYSSSGSTGTPTRILYSWAMHQRYSAAFEARGRNWAGVNRKMRRGMIGGRRILPEGASKGPFHRYNFAEKQLYLSAYHISPDHIPAYAKALFDYEIEYMNGYAMSNYYLAEMALEQRIQLPPMKAVLTSSEPLTAEMRKTFEDAYGCKTFDGYNGVEAACLLTENEYGQLLVSPDVGIVEILREDGSPCAPGETGEVVCTSLINRDQPLIRYRMGDRATLAADQSTRCGRNLPVIAAIEGRVEDTLTGPDGRKMVRFHGIFVDLPAVVQGQVIQWDREHFQVRILCEHTPASWELESIRKRMESQLGNIQLEIEQVNHFEPGPNGKFRAVINHMKS